MKIKDLLDFNKLVIDLDKKRLIKGPYHLCGAKRNKQAKKLIKIFKKYYKKGDWIFTTYRNHWHWLLSGRDKTKLLNFIKEGNSMHIFDNKFFTSAIVGGHAPIAVGVALALKLKKSKNKVLCFLGDMAYKSGIVKEAIQYSQGHDLPIIFIVEDNNRSVYTKTSDVWGNKKSNKVIKYKYKPIYKHHGSRLETEDYGGLF